MCKSLVKVTAQGVTLESGVTYERGGETWTVLELREDTAGHIRVLVENRFGKLWVYAYDICCHMRHESDSQSATGETPAHF